MELHKIDIRGLIILAYVNVAIWSVAIITLVFMLNRYPGIKGFYTIFAAGTCIGIILLIRLRNIKKSIKT